MCKELIGCWLLLDRRKWPQHEYLKQLSLSFQFSEKKEREEEKKEEKKKTKKKYSKPSEIQNNIRTANIRLVKITKIMTLSGIHKAGFLSELHLRFNLLCKGRKCLT